MKNISKIALISLSVLGLVALIWVIVDYDPKLDENILIGKSSTAFIVGLALFTSLVTAILFLIFKVRDIIIHPSHLKELLIVIGIVVVAIIIGLIFGGSEDVLTTEGRRLGPGESRLIGAGLIASITLLLVSAGFLIYDSVKATLK